MSSYSFPVKDYLRKNLVLSASDTQRINDEISDLQAELDLCPLSEQSHFKAAIAMRRSLFAPVRRLPPEILCKIFLLTLPQTTFRRPSTKEAPLHLTHVCSAWRSIAHSFPRLWTSLRVGTVPSRVPLIQAWLARSGSYPLDVATSMYTEAHFIITGALVAHAHRWREVRLSARALINRRLINLSMLETLYLHSHRNRIHEGRSDVYLTDAAPLLRNLTLSYYHPERFPPLYLPWSQLTSLTFVGDLHLRGSLNLIRRCYNLRTLTMDSRGHIFDDDVLIIQDLLLPQPSSTVLPHLHTCTISLPQNVVKYVFEALTLPALRIVEATWAAQVWLVEINVLWPHEQFMALAARSEGLPHFERIALKRYGMTDLQARECFLQIPTLKEIDLGEVMGGDGSLIQRVKYRDGYSPI